MEDDFCLYLPNSDIAFRKAVKDTLIAIGINEDVIEEGLEKYSDIWRKKYMLKAFNNKYYNALDIMSYDIEEPLQIHKNIWIKVREYEYYCKHKNSVDLYGQVTDNMKLSLEEVRKLKLYLYKKDIERLYYIKKCKRNSSEKQRISYFSEDIPFQIRKNIRQ